MPEEEWLAFLWGLPHFLICARSVQNSVQHVNRQVQGRFPRKVKVGNNWFWLGRSLHLPHNSNWKKRQNSIFLLFRTVWKVFQSTIKLENYVPSFSCQRLFEFVKINLVWSYPWRFWYKNFCGKFLPVGCLSLFTETYEILTCPYISCCLNKISKFTKTKNLHITADVCAGIYRSMWCTNFLTGCFKMRFLSTFHQQMHAAGWRQKSMLIGYKSKFQRI